MASSVTDSPPTGPSARVSPLPRDSWFLQGVSVGTVSTALTYVMTN